MFTERVFSSLLLMIEYSYNNFWYFTECYELHVRNATALEIPDGKVTLQRNKSRKVISEKKSFVENYGPGSWLPQVS